MFLVFIKETETLIKGTTNRSVPDSTLRAAYVGSQTDVVIGDHCVPNKLPMIICVTQHITSVNADLHSSPSLTARSCHQRGVDEKIWDASPIRDSANPEAEIGRQRTTIA